MSQTDQQTMQQALRRELASTIGLLTDEHDFRAMRHYRTFVFDDYATYLHQVEAVLRARAAQGTHTALTLFDPEEYSDFCALTGLEPDAPSSRSRFTAEAATTGPSIPYEGQPLAELVPDLVDQAVQLATWQYATAVLARLGPCAVCGEDIGQAALTHASHIVTRILDTAGPGKRHLVCSVSADPETLIVTLHTDKESGSPDLAETDLLEFTSVLAVGIATRSSGGLVVRTNASGATGRVYAWRLHEGRLEPLTAGEVFDAYCTDADSGDPISPGSDVDYCSPPGLGDEGLVSGHPH